MTETPQAAIAFGAPQKLSPGSTHKRCAECGGPCWFAAVTWKRLETIAKSMPVTYVCLPCSPKAPPSTSGRVEPFSAEEVAYARSRGEDWTAEQMRSNAEAVFAELRTHVHRPHHVENGELNEAQRSALRPFIAERHVYDLGAGDCALTAELVCMGARHVVAVDEKFREVHTYGPVTMLGAWFHELQAKEDIEVAFVSWPTPIYTWPPAPRYAQGLIDLCDAAPVVAYLGSNFGSRCGNVELWQHLGTREVLAHVPDPRNTLIVYGRKGRRIPGQGLLPEEKAALYWGANPLPVYGVTYG